MELSIRTKDEESEFQINTNDIETDITLLKTNKSFNPFDLVAEHILYAENDNLNIWLCDLFNEIFKTGKTPKELSKSRMIPLGKSLLK